MRPYTLYSPTLACLALPLPGENPDKAPLLSSVQLVVARSGQMVAPCGPGEAQLQVRVGLRRGAGRGGGSGFKPGARGHGVWSRYNTSRRPNRARPESPGAKGQVSKVTGGRRGGGFLEL